VHPILFRLGPITIHTYGLFVALGFLTAVSIARWQGRKAGLAVEKLVDLAFYAALAAIVGSRILFVLIEWDYFARNPLASFKIWEGGLVFLGGVALAVPVGLFYARRAGLPLWETADVFAPALSAGHVLGRIGCFFAGCCYGDRCNLPWAVTFTDPESLAPLGVGLHPTQLYESFGELVIFLVLITVIRRKTFHGQVFVFYGFLYPLLRFVVEFFRGDDVRGFIAGGLISTSQLGSLVMAVLALVGWFALSRNRRLTALPRGRTSS